MDDFGDTGRGCAVPIMHLLHIIVGRKSDINREKGNVANSRILILMKLCVNVENIGNSYARSYFFSAAFHSQGGEM